ncbi:phosphatase PAP2 family protein [Sebaldella sp. S0638]|uniref:phosphatase PAP2 family protein n=1 Tax=Sebaldella sp. S0638 TaxID=2957809 RepID=UPI0020A04280|nr:phosphatase PAP2 family protein [Sebaldella sp. S0638]MCP1225119.1 phosphatase PAP2 family protein [Sebaldella sp. S0638]
MLNVLDQVVVNTVNIIQNPLLDRIMIFFTSLGDKGIIWIMLLIILSVKKETRKTAAAMTVSVIIVFIITNYLKDTFQRIRPYEYMHFIPKVTTSGTSSFPSAHSAVAFAVFGISYFYKLKFRYIIGVIALMISVSRFYLEVHYFTDVLAGVSLGFIISYILFYIPEVMVKHIRINNLHLYKRFFPREKR